MNRPSDEIVERMVTLVGSVASYDSISMPNGLNKDAQLILAMIKPVDSDVLAAREIYKSGIRNIRPEVSEAINNGQYDNYDYLVGCIAGIRHARDGGWIEWHGGDCPVPGNRETTVRFRGGFERTDDEPEGWRWEVSGGSLDIVAYRVVK